MQGEAAASWEGGRGTGDAQVGPKHATAAERQRRSRAKRKMQMEEAERARGEARGGARGGASDAGGTVLIGGAQVGGRDSHDAPMPAGDGGGRESHIAQPAGMGAPPTASAEPTTGDQEGSAGAAGAGDQEGDQEAGAGSSGGAEVRPHPRAHSLSN